MMDKRGSYPIWFVLVALALLTACGGGGGPESLPEPSATAEPAASATRPPKPTAATTPTPAPSPTPVPSPTASGMMGELSIGQTERGSIDEAGGESRWTLEGAEGDTIYLFVEAVRGGVEPFVTLQDSDGSLVASSERSESDFEATLLETLPDDGTYEVVVSSYGDETGTYEISAFSAEAGGGDLQYGESVSGFVLGGVTEEVWTFEAAEGDFVNVDVTGSGDGFDSLLTLTNEDGDVITTDDDSGGDLNPQLRNFPLLVEGTYRLVVSAYEDNNGPYELTLEPGEASGGGTLAIDETVTDQLGEEETHLWTFEAQAGDTVDILANAANPDDFLDLFFTLYGPNGQPINYDDDSGGDRNARLTGVELTESGRYAIVVEAYSSGGEGYELTVRRSQTEATAGGAIAYGQTVTGTLEGGPGTAWSFEAQTGDVITVSLRATGDDLDGYLILLGPQGEELASDDDGGGELNPQIVGFPLLATGTYQIIAQAYRGSGDYELTLERGPATGGGTLTYGQPVEGTIANGSPHIWTFQGEQGDTIQVAAISEALDLRLTLYDPAGVEFANDDDSGGDLNLLLSDIALPASGTYTLYVSTFSGGSGAYTLNVTGQ